MPTLPDLSSVALHIQGACGIREAVAAFQPTLIVSIANPEEARDPLADHEGAPIVRLRFHDGRPMRPGAVWASFSHMQAVADALDDRDIDAPVRLLVHCGAGERRSPALAMFALSHLLTGGREHPLTQEEARSVVESVYCAAPNAEPDESLISLATEHLESYHLMEAFEERKRVKNLPKQHARILSKGEKLRGSKGRKAFRA